MLARLKSPFESASGKVGQETVLFSWRGSQCARVWARPSNPKTQYQQTVRDNLTTLTRDWSSLTPTQRKSWEDYAAAHLVTNRMGVTVKNTGLGLYVRCNSIRLLMGETSVATAPTGNPPNKPAAITLYAAETGLAFAVTHAYSAGLFANFKLMVAISPPVTEAVRPDIRLTSLVGLTEADSFTAMVASGTQQAIANTRRIAEDGLAYIFALQFVEKASGLVSGYTVANCVAQSI